MFIYIYLYTFTDQILIKKTYKWQHQEPSSKWKRISRRAKYDNLQGLLPLIQIYTPIWKY